MLRVCVLALVLLLCSRRNGWCGVTGTPQPPGCRWRLPPPQRTPIVSHWPAMAQEVVGGVAAAAAAADAPSVCVVEATAAARGKGGM